MSWRQSIPRPVRRVARHVLERLHVCAPLSPLDPDYPRWIARRRALRAVHYPGPPAHDRPAIDLLTLTCNTQAAILRRTAASVRAQDYAPRRWVIWDNGSTRPGTLAVLEELEREEWIEVCRAEYNLGITRGHFEALRQCHGEYVALLDHDDELYPDALRIVAEWIAAHDRPPLVYSDEDKLDEQGRPYCPFFKPDWSPALLQSTPYVCHLTVFRRDLADELGFFTDPTVEGTQDWDLALRCHDAGYQGVHVPEVLYSWRMAHGSTSLRLKGKEFVLASQRRCLEASLRRRGLDGRFVVEPDPIYPFHDGHWHLRRRDDALGGIHVLHGSNLGEALASAPRDADYLAFAPPGVRLAADWCLQGVAQLELNLGAGLVGGRVLDKHNLLVAGGAVLGQGGYAFTLNAGRDASDVGYFGLPLTPREVSALGHVPCIIRGAALAEVPVAARQTLNSISQLAPLIATAGWRIVATPHVVGWIRTANELRVPQESVTPISPDQSDDPYYSPCAALEPRRAYHPDRGDQPRFRGSGVSPPALAARC